MRFTFFKFAAFVSLASLGWAQDSCDEGSDKAPFAPGLTGGEPFPSKWDHQMHFESRWRTGDTIVGIEAWSAKFQLKAIKFKFAMTGWTNTFGTVPDGDPWQHDVAEWGAGEEVAVKMWNNKPDDGDPMDAVNKVEIFKGENKIFEVGGASDKTSSDILDINQGAGLILGVKVRSGAWITSLEFKMLKSKVVSSELTDLSIAEDMKKWNEQQKGMENVALRSVYFVNENKVGGPNLTYKFSNVVRKEVSKTLTHETTNMWGGSISVTVGGGVEIPFLTEANVEVATTAEYQNTNMNSRSDTWTDGQDLTYDIGSPGESHLLPPQKAVHCAAWAVTGRFDSPFTGIVKAKLGDGSTYNYKTTGKVSSVGWVSGRTSCKEVDLKDVPSNAVKENGKPLNERKSAIIFRG